MKKNLEKTLVEMFGDPVEPPMGMNGKKIGDLPGITTVGAVGVRDMQEDDLGDVCPQCNMMSIDGKCGCPEPMMVMGGESIEQPCSSCGMPGSQCTCSGHDACPVCGMMSTNIDSPSGCGMNGEGCGKMNEKSCSECGMNEATCECGYMNEAEKEKDSVKSREYHGKEYKASAGSIAALKKHGGSKEKAIKAGAFDWSKNPEAAARAAEIVATGKAKPTR